MFEGPARECIVVVGVVGVVEVVVVVPFTRFKGGTRRLRGRAVDILQAIECLVAIMASWYCYPGVLWCCDADDTTSHWQRWIRINIESRD